ncbi:hypothetical protein [Geodermatophilus sp. URMC 63]
MRAERGTGAAGSALRRDEEETISETPLEDVPGATAEDTSRLGEVWITSAEQLVAVAATTGGIPSLAQQLQTSEDRVRQLVENARATLTPEARDDLDRPVDAGEYGLGVLPPRSRDEEHDGG